MCIRDRTNTYVLGHADSVETIASADTDTNRLFDELIMLNKITVKTVNNNIIPRQSKKIPGASLFHPFLTGTINEKVDKVTQQLSHCLSKLL